MAIELILTPECEVDLDDAFAWYESQRVGLGEDFLSRVDACINTILRFPELNAVVHGNYRRALVRRYPYSVFYEFIENRVTVYGVFHMARDPAKWRERLN